MRSWSQIACTLSLPSRYNVSAAIAVACACFDRPPGRPTFASACSSSLEACLGSLADEIALKLGEGCEKVEHQPSLRRGGVNRIVEANEADLACHKFVGERDQVLEASP